MSEADKQSAESKLQEIVGHYNVLKLCGCKECRSIREYGDLRAKEARAQGHTANCGVHHSRACDCGR